MSKGDRDAKRQEGVVFMTVGAGLVALCGACTWNGFHSHDTYFSAYSIFGFAPIAVGAWMFLRGLIEYMKSED